jgi:hypothetical protein
MSIALALSAPPSALMVMAWFHICANRMAGQRSAVIRSSI